MNSLKSVVWLSVLGALLSCGASEGAQKEDSAPAVSDVSQTVEPISIFGTVQNPIAGAPITLTQFKDNATVAKIDLELDANGNFAHTLSLPEPTIFQLNVQNTQRLVLVLHDEDISIMVDGANAQAPFTTEGSADTDYLEEIFALNAAKSNTEAELNQKFLEARNSNDQTTMVAIQRQAMGLQAELSNRLVALLEERGPSLAAMQAVQFIDEGENLEFLTAFAEELLEEVPTETMVRSWKQRLDVLNTTTVGSIAPDLAFPTPTGETLALSDLRGQYVLLDFWASWCKPCRVENPNVVAAYEAYKDQGFTVLGVSLDQNGGKWTEAISADGLVWNHISDLGGWRSAAAAAYGVQSIPANYLIDPEGKIIATELRGPALHQKLAEVLGNNEG